MKPITAYRCEHCPKARVMVTERAMKKHEAQCIHNPAERACPSCRNDWRDDSRYCEAGVLIPLGSMLLRKCEKWEPREGLGEAA
jgi:hypothetical protein